MLAVLAPGQGSQRPGQLSPWLDVPGVRERLRWLSAVSGVDLLHAGTDADEAAIRDTTITQPLLVAAGLIGADALLELTREPIADVAVGHSVGEITAAAVTHALSHEAAVALAGVRGRAMAAASAVAPTGMAAVIGGTPSDVLDSLTELGLEAANVNGAAQVVAAGPLEALDRLAADPPAGTRVRRLPVAGAFHTTAMVPARDELASLAEAVPFTDPGLRLLSNLDGTVVSTGRELRRRLIAQVALPVRFDACIETLAALGVTAVLELPPAGTLGALVRRELPGVETVGLRTPDDLAAAADLVARHREVVVGGHLPAWRVLVSPRNGTFHAGGLTVGDHIAVGASVGTVRDRRHEQEVVAPYGGVLLEWLASDGDPVSPGQPLARLHPVTDTVVVP